MDSDVTVTLLDGSVWLVELTGDHDLSTAPAVDDALEELHRHGTDIVLDLTGTSFIDSSFVGTVAAHAGRPGERLVLVAPAGSRARRLLDLVRLGSVIPIVDTRTEAVESLTG